MFKVNYQYTKDIYFKKNEKKGLAALAKLEDKIKKNEIGFFSLPNDFKNINKIKLINKEISKTSDTLVVVGIGGSSLGAKTIITALTDNFQKQRVLFSENVDSDYFYELISSLDLEKTTFNIISKSGSTAETMAQFLIIYKILKEKKINPIDKIIFTTDPEKGVLRKLSKDMGFKTLEVPENVGGRFSVLSSVGLLPCAFAKIDIDKLLDGSKKVLENFKINNILENEVLKYSVIKHSYHQDGKNISVLMPYSSKLKELSNWYVQLWAESLGKEGKGQTPIPSIGANDQHSQLQLFMDGPRDKFVTFIGIEKVKHEIKIPNFEIKLDSLNYLSNHTLSKLLNSEMLSTAKALYKNETPSISIEISKLDEYNLGMLIMFFQISVAITGEMLEVNTFNQPGVELSKNYTYEMMGRKK